MNGEVMELGDYQGKYIYEQGAPLGFDASNPLSSAEASKLLELTKMVRWEREVNAHLLAGWCVVATICGALKWRPHIWITGGAGTGKTWILGAIVKPLLNTIALFVQGSTTEPGLRQALKTDALPVAFDEAEGGDTRNDQERMQSVLNLMRAASAEDGGNMIKGGQGGSGAISYQTRSCFCFRLDRYANEPTK